MSTLGLAGTADPPKPGFWWRVIWRKASIFDVILGVIAPILCFTFDPLVFRGTSFGDPFLPRFQVFVYLLSGLEILTLVLWLTAGKFLPAKRFVGGILLAGGVFCVGIGIAILPLSLVGLLFVFVGIFGFTPFLTGLVYLRNGFQAVSSEQETSSFVGRGVPILLGCLLAISLPASISLAIHHAVSVSVNAVILGDSDRAAFGSETLTWLRPVSGDQLDRIVDAYSNVSDPVLKERLSKSYLEITGEDIAYVARIREHNLGD